MQFQNSSKQTTPAQVLETTQEPHAERFAARCLSKTQRRLQPTPNMGGERRCRNTETHALLSKIKTAQNPQTKNFASMSSFQKNRNTYNQLRNFSGQPEEPHAESLASMWSFKEHKNANTHHRNSSGQHKYLMLKSSRERCPCKNPHTKNFASMSPFQKHRNVYNQLQNFSRQTKKTHAKILASMSSFKKHKDANMHPQYLLKTTRTPHTEECAEILSFH